jgi:hypothetical protein
MLTAKAPVLHWVTGECPDVLAYAKGAHQLYVAAENGTLTTPDLHDRTLVLTGTGHLVGNAHVVAVDPDTHRSYYPPPASDNGHPMLLECQPS